MAGRVDELQEALRQNPHAPELHNELGIAHAVRNEPAAAKLCFERALQLRPAYAVAWQNLSRVLLLGGWPHEAEIAALRAVAYAPRDPLPLRNLSQLLRQAGRWAEGVATARHALEAARDTVPANPAQEVALAGELATLLHEAGDANGALAVVGTTLERFPEELPLREQRALLLRAAQREIEAEQEYRAVLERNPDSPTACANLAHLLADWGRTEEAREHYATADRLQPNARVRVAWAATLPVILESREALTRERNRLRASIDTLVQRGDQVDTARESMPNLFGLAYHGEPDREFHEAWGRAATPVDWLERLPRPARFGEPRRPVGRSGSGGRLRVGVVSRYLRDHTIGRLNLGWMEHLPREDIELVVLPVGPVDDPLARRFRATADQFVPLPWSVPGALNGLRGAKLDTLVFLDVGMDPVSLALAASRVAPRQAVTWGHPVTTGLPTVNDFISAATAEVPGADEQYTERLVRLSRLGVRYERPEFDPALSDKSAWGVERGTPLLACPQSLFKIHPDFDVVLSQILSALPTARLALIEGRHPEWRSQLEARWERGGYAHICERIVWLPPLPRAKFLGLLKAADVVLDTFPFCGGNSSYETFAAGTPLVTLPTDLLRGRLTLAMYEQMGWRELVARDVADYVGKVVRLILEPDYARECRREIAERTPRLLEDDTAALDWAGYLLESAELRA